MQKLLLYICIVFLCAQCAQITPLTGGKKDDSAPKALSYNPKNASLNFDSKVVEIQFDEYLVLKDVANQFIITPQTKEMPDIQVSGKKLKIIFNEKLLKNTTYKLAFGNAVTDLNEANVLQNFEYIFSTGPQIDSLKLYGKIVTAIDKKPVDQILIGLYNTDVSDSAIYKEKPLYITKTNSEGSFNFNYLPNSKFKIVGIKDQNKNLLYDGSEEQIAYSNQLISTNDTNSIDLVLFKEVPTKNFIKKFSQVEIGKADVIFSKAQIDIETVRADSLIKYVQNKTKDTLSLFYTKRLDTLKTFIYHSSGKIDTVHLALPTVNALKRLNTSFKYNLQSNISSTLPFHELPTFKLNYPLNGANINSSKIRFIEKVDTILQEVPFIIMKDTGLITTFKIKANIKQETNYILTILKDALIDVTKRANDSITYQFKTTSVDDYAQLSMKLVFPKKENYIIQLLNDKEQIVSERVQKFSLASSSEKIMMYENLIPGNYYVKVVEDANDNGIYDTGDYFLRKQPEVIFVNTTPVKLLAGWEIENEWIVK